MQSVRRKSVKLTMLYEGLERLHSNLLRGGAGPGNGGEVGR